jgi:hypothetical protein
VWGAERLSFELFDRRADQAARAFRAQGCDVIGSDDDDHIRAAIERAKLVVVAWGCDAVRVHPRRPHTVLSWIADPYCFGVTANGSPVHPNCRGPNRAVRPVRYIADDGQVEGGQSAKSPRDTGKRWGTSRSSTERFP